MSISDEEAVARQFLLTQGVLSHRTWTFPGAQMAGNSRSLIPAPAAAASVISGTPVFFDFRLTTSVSRARQKVFRTEFIDGLGRLQAWCHQNGWVPTCHRKLEIQVSDELKISKSLVPAWFGRQGYLEFPAWRVKAGEAAIVHELAHVYFPNANRLLAEGLAIALQATLGRSPAFPNFGRPLHDFARRRLADMVADFRPGEPASLAAVRIEELDRIATPSPLVLQVGARVYGEDAFGQTHLYAIAGSFVQFLIEQYGLDSLGALFARTPLVPFEQNAGSPERWLEVYGLPLYALERQWRAVMASRASPRDGLARSPAPNRNQERIENVRQ